MGSTSCTVTVMMPAKLLAFSLSPLPENWLLDSPPRLKLRSRSNSLALMPGMAETPPEMLPLRSMDEDEDWLALTFSVIWIVRLSPGRRARGSSNAGR
ncbi:hypothetical protein D9M68_1004210 [compost metagenome]